MSEINRTVHCWYSEAQDKRWGHVLYRINGILHKVTDASSTNTASNCASKWPDMQYVGQGVFERGGQRKHAYEQEL